MNGPGKLVFQHGIDATLTFHPAKTFEGRRHEPDMEMGFTPAAILAGGAGMPGMAGAFVHDVHFVGRKGGG